MTNAKGKKNVNVRRTPSEPSSDHLKRAYLVLKYAHETCRALCEAFDNPGGRPRIAGSPTDEQQDLLRAMLLFAGAGLDSMVKYLLKDVVTVMVEKDKGALEAARKWVKRRLSRPLADGDDGGLDEWFLASALLSESPKEAVLAAMVDDLTGHSLQSYEELCKALGPLGLSAKDCGLAEERAREVFGVRNRVAHEMDIDFDKPNRNRFPRKRVDMINMANYLLECADNILRAVEEKLS